MTHDLQNLLDKIQREGVDKAQAEADRIIEQAHAQARSILETAKGESARLLASARQEAESFERRAEATIRQSARDTVLSVERAVTALLDRLLTREVSTALAGTELAASLAAEAVRAYLAGGGPVEVTAAAKLADALRARLAAEAASGVSVVTDETTGAGFRVRLDHGRVEHTFTGQAVTDALSRQLRPRLAALLKPN